MEAVPFIVPAGLILITIVQTACILCIHRRVKRLETAPVQQTWIPEPTYYGVPIPQWQPPPSAPPADWRGSVI